MSWLAQTQLVGIVLSYLVFLFLVAALAERYHRQLVTPRLRTATYVLAASVYCTAWTFYGSVGFAANRGLEFLTIYLGPVLIALLWPTLLRKLVRVAKEQRITTVSDFIASRYGRSAPLGTLVAALVVCGMIPYIALQLKAVSVSFRLMLGDAVLSGWDPAPLVAMTLAVFGILFGARNLDFTRRQTGLMTAVAVESIVKLVAFLVVGAFVTWGLFDGFGDIFTRVAARPEGAPLVILNGAGATSYARWAALLLVSMTAVMLLPRQFHVLVVQSPGERDVQTVAWAFPLYLLLMNIFVLPLAGAGLLLFPGEAAAADTFILALPLGANAGLIALVTFLGGFSAATAMIVVDSLALSRMISNDIVLPVLLRGRRVAGVYATGLASTRLGVVLVVGLGLLWAQVEAGQFLLVEMGLLSFIAVAQCAPAVLLGLAWRRGNRAGAAAGIILGFAVWFYTLIIPTLAAEEVLPASLLAEGPFGLTVLRPTALLGLTALDTLTHGIFWSLFLNVAAYVLVSVATGQDADERTQAAAFVGLTRTEPAPISGVLSVPEIERLIHLYVPAEEAAAVVQELLAGKQAHELALPDLLELRIRLERLLAASLGGAAARYIVEDRFSISKGEAGQLVASFQAMQRSLRTSERLLASVVESVDDCIFTTDGEGQLITLNPAGRQLLRVSTADLTVSYLDVVDEADRHRVGPAVARAVGAGRRWRGAITGLTRDGRRFPAHLAISCVFDAQGQVLGTVGVLRDLTEQVATQQRLVQREKLASLGEMAAGVAHEIRNPLGGIKMATNLMSSGEVNDPRISREMAASILSGIAEIEAIIDDLLDYTRDTRLDRQEYEMAWILAPIVETCTTEGRQRGIRVTARGLDANLTATVDGQRLRQVFANVVKNALEATERRPDPRVDVALYARDGAAVVEVRDNGVGMRPEHRERLFLPFFTTKPMGTGLGMAIVKKIMDLHGGEIEIQSVPEVGTTVRLVIPRTPRQATVCEVGHAWT